MTNRIASDTRMTASRPAMRDFLRPSANGRGHAAALPKLADAEYRVIEDAAEDAAENALRSWPELAGVLDWVDLTNYGFDGPAMLEALKDAGAEQRVDLPGDEVLLAALDDADVELAGLGPGEEPVSLLDLRMPAERVMDDLNVRGINGRTIEAHGRKRVVSNPLPVSAVFEILESAGPAIAKLESTEAMKVRVVLRREMAKWIGSGSGADDLMRRYVPDGVQASPYDTDGILHSLDLADPASAPEFLIPGFMPSASVGLLLAPFSMGKTWFCAALGCGVAFNHGAPVRFILGEGVKAFPRRLAGWLVHNGTLDVEFGKSELAETLEGRISISGPLMLDDPQAEEALTRTIEADGSRLVVLDTLGRLLGGAAESDNDDANRIMGMLQRVASRTSATFLIVHHPGHAGDRARGASGWEQAADFVFNVKGTSDHFGRGVPVRLVNRKQRDAELAADLHYSLAPVEAVCDGEQWATAVLRPAAPPAPELPLEERIGRVVADTPGMTKRQVCAAVTGRTQDIGAAIDRLLTGGRLENRGSGNAFALHLAADEWPELAENEFEAGGGPAPDLSDLAGSG